MVSYFVNTTPSSRIWQREAVQLKHKQEPHPPLHLICDDVSVT